MIADLLLVYEPEADCIARLRTQGIADNHARDIASYLAQARDIAPEFTALTHACGERGLHFRPVELDALAATLAHRMDRQRLVWTLTDGFAFYRGSHAPASAMLAGANLFGTDASLFFLAQDKFRCGAVLREIGLPCPPALLVRNGTQIAGHIPDDMPDGYFVKPNRLGAKVGIWPDSHARTLQDAFELSRRIHAAYGDDALVQAYVPGRNLRVSYLDVSGQADMRDAGIFSIDSGGDFQSMYDSLQLYGETGETARASGTYREPAITDLRATQDPACAQIDMMLGTLQTVLGLRDVFSADFRLAESGDLHLLEIEVCPGLPCFDFRHYVRARWGIELVEAVAASAAARAFADTA